MSPVVVALATTIAWFLLLGDDPASWIIGIPCVALAAYLGSGLPASGTVGVSMRGWWRLIVYFLHHSLVGGWDVARRVLQPGLPLNPGYIDFDLRIPDGPARTFYIQIIGLLPGTLGVWCDDSHLTVHVLDVSAHPEQPLRDAERRVADAFALPMVDGA